MNACRSRTRDGRGDEPTAAPGVSADAEVIEDRRLLMENATREMRRLVWAVKYGSCVLRSNATVDARHEWNSCDGDPAFRISMRS